MLLGAPVDRSNENKKGDGWFSGVSSRLSRRRGQGTEGETESFGSGRSHRFSFGDRATPRNSEESDFDLESFVGFGTLSGDDDDVNGAKSANQRGEGIGDRPSVVETESRAHVDSDGQVSAGGVSGFSGGRDLSAVDLESEAGVNENSKGFLTRQR